VNTRKAREVKQALNSKGFREDAKRDHIYYFLYHEGRKTAIHTKISHNERDIDSPLLSQMARQLRVSKSQFNDLLDCPLTAGGYVEFLIAHRYVVPREN
jgi:hypothetical protein